MHVNNLNVARFSFFAKCIYFFLFFFSILFIVNPEQSYYIQQPLFLFDTHFLFGYLTYPGGLVDYFTQFFSQFYRYPLLGALIITVTALAVLLFTNNILKFFNFDRFRLFLNLAPVAALWYLHSFSNATLTTSLVLLFTLILFYYHLKVSGKPLYVRLIGYLLSSSVVFYSTGGAGLLLFQGLCLSNECVQFHKKQSIPVIFIILLSGLIPYIAARFLFYITLKQAYLHLFIPGKPYQPKFILPVLYFYYPLMIILCNFIPQKNNVKGGKSNIAIISLIMQVFIVGITTLLSTIQSLQSDEEFTCKIKYLAYSGKWQQLLDATKNHESTDRLVMFNVNKALYFTGRLPYDLFRHPNFMGQHALFLGGYTFGSITIDNSELYFDLGHIHAARQWAYEAQTVYENSPRVLKMLAITNVIEGDYKAANIMLQILRWSTLFDRI